MAKRTTTYGSVLPEHVAILREHAHECDRSLTRENGNWVTLGALTICYADTFRAEKQREKLAQGWSETQLEHERISYFEEMAALVHRALPHSLDAGLVFRAALPRINQN